jgi:hypothetical protein
MPYQRKTKDVFVIQGRYPGPYGWEDECEEETRDEGRAQLKCYRENGSGEYRMKKRRVKLEAAPVPKFPVIRDGVVLPLYREKETTNAH